MRVRENVFYEQTGARNQLASSLLSKQFVEDDDDAHIYTRKRVLKMFKVECAHNNKFTALPGEDCLAGA